jgi:hypothetical protein
VGSGIAAFLDNQYAGRSNTGSFSLFQKVISTSQPGRAGSDNQNINLKDIALYIHWFLPAWLKASI